MRVSSSIWQPWTLRESWSHDYTPTELMQPLFAIGPGARLAIKAVDLFEGKSNAVGLYGPDPEWSMFGLDKYAGRSNDHVVAEAQRQGWDVEGWVYIRLEYPHDEAQAVKRAIERWDLRAVYLDVEGHAKPRKHNTGAFLRSIGILRRSSGERIPVYLQSYHSPLSYRAWPDRKIWWHSEIDWRAWLTTQVAGEYVVTGLSPQAYPEPVVDEATFAARYRTIVEQYEWLATTYGRPFEELPWVLTVPTYKERGWLPPASAIRAGVDAAAELLGDRLVGVNAFRHGFLMTDQFAAHLQMLVDLHDPATLQEPDIMAKFLELPEADRWQYLAGALERLGELTEEGRIIG